MDNDHNPLNEIVMDYSGRYRDYALVMTHITIENGPLESS